MEIEVRLFATFQQGRFRRKMLDLPDGATPEDVCRQLGIGPQEVAILLVGGQDADRRRPLVPGDVLSLFPAIGGG